MNRTLNWHNSWHFTLSKFCTRTLSSQIWIINIFSTFHDSKTFNNFCELWRLTNAFMLIKIFACFSARFANRLRKCCDALRPPCFAIYTSFSTLRAPSIITIEHFFVLDFSVGAENGAEEINNEFLREFASLNFYFSRVWLYTCIGLQFGRTAAELLLLEMIAQEIMSCGGSENYFSFVLGVLRQPKTLNRWES